MPQNSMMLAYDQTHNWLAKEAGQEPQSHLHQL
jgi:hypothetical protein